MKRLKQMLAELDADDESPKAEAIRVLRAIELLDQIRSMAWSILIAFAIMGLLIISLFSMVQHGKRELQREARSGREQNRIAICDLYRQTGVIPPAGIDCQP